jgi:hypothetical protein
MTAASKSAGRTGRRPSTHIEAGNVSTPIKLPNGTDRLRWAFNSAESSPREAVSAGATRHSEPVMNGSSAISQHTGSIAYEAPMKALIPRPPLKPSVTGQH